MVPPYWERVFWLSFFRTAMTPCTDPYTSEPFFLAEEQGEYPLGLHMKLLKDPKVELIIEDVYTQENAEYD
jgi:hypothetical protein